MGEPEAIKAINDGYTFIDGEMYNVTIHPRGWCDGCYFDTYGENGTKNRCPDLALKICCTGGHILTKKD